MDEVLAFRLGRLFDAYKAADGEFVTLASFTDHVGELAELRGHPADEPRVVALVQNLTDLWNQVAPGADLDQDGRISRDEWMGWFSGMVGFLRQSIANGDPWPLDDWITTLFGVIDADGDGHIVLDEYQDWLDVLHLSDGMDVAAVFASFDKGRHGYLSRDEFAAVTKAYWTNFDPTIPEHHWLGGTS